MVTGVYAEVGSCTVSTSLQVSYKIPHFWYLNVDVQIFPNHSQHLTMASTVEAIPIVVGVGDFKNKSSKLEDAMEPMELMLRAIQQAIADTGLSTASADKLQSQIDSIDVVRTWTWPYADLPDLLAKKLGAGLRHKFYSEHGGNQPGKLFDEAARRISQGESKLAVLAGGEALASRI